MNHQDAPKRNIRIALVLFSLVGGGTERVALSLAKAFLIRGYQVDIVLRRAKGELLGLLPDEARLFELGCDGVTRIPIAFAGYLRREQPDAVIANMWPLTSMCVIGHRLARSKSRMAIVEHAPLSPVPRYRSWRRQPFLRSTLALSCRLADVRIAVSSGVADDIAHLASLRRDRIKVVYNPVEISANPCPKNIYDIWDGTRAKRILTVGRLSEEKNQLLLLDAFSRVIEGLDARLVILGEGPSRRTLERRVAELGLEHVVKLPGFMTNPVPAYNSADLFVLSSDFEGFGNVIVEALACGVPVVSTDCPSGPREILANGEFGALVPCGSSVALADAMLEALARDHNAVRLKARASDFSLEKAADAYLREVFGTNAHSTLRHVKP